MMKIPWIALAIANTTWITPVIASPVVPRPLGVVVIDASRTFRPKVTRRLLPLRPPSRPLDIPVKKLLNGPLKYIWPTKGVFTSGFGPRWGRMHRGIDIAAPTGTTVVASASGVIKFAGWNSGGYGNLVEIEHPGGSSTRYAHNSRILVKVGQPVQQGQQIALVGSTGRSTGPHTHFEIRKPGLGAVNPLRYLRKRG